ncbi:hypothetical protein [Sphingomicrobium sediminis]|uniref:Uncharacterized protein n=1 Tax=Sphingomicrobium sediminis TaxID=2950949 RepID=A0A9X2J5K7_9SPHN|nr:hypothetical protein [Sphingomicrobium sediminis]MCM8558342.1 hypothetical protein [Sphingomicrobium sediminis]
MLALWRRVRGAVGDIGPTEWALLGIETVAVVGGIVIAFQLEQWAEDRREARDRDELAERLLEEAEDSVAILRAERDLMAERGTSVDTMLKAWIVDGKCPPAELAFSRYHSPLNVPTAVYDEMIGSGGLALLAGERERRAVAHYAARRMSFEQRQEHYRAATNYDLAPVAGNGIRPVWDEDRQFYRLERTRETGCDDPTQQLQAVFDAQMFKIQQASRVDLTDAAISMCGVLAHHVGRTCSPNDAPLEGRDADIARDAAQEAMR